MKNIFLHPVVVLANGFTIAKSIKEVNTIPFSTDKEKMESLQNRLIKYGAKLQEGTQCSLTTNFSYSTSNFQLRYLGVDHPVICSTGDVLFYIENGNVSSKYCQEVEMVDDFCYSIKLSQPNFLESRLSYDQQKVYIELNADIADLLDALSKDLKNPLDADQLEQWLFEFEERYEEFKLLKKIALNGQTIDGIGEFYSFQHFEMVYQELKNLYLLLKENDFVLPALEEIQMITDSREQKKWLDHYSPLYKRIIEFSNTHLFKGSNLFEQVGVSGVQLTFNPIKIKDERLSNIMLFVKSYKTMFKEVKGKNPPDYSFVI